MVKRLIAFGLTEYRTKDDEKKTKWTRIGAAFRNADGSFNVELEALPLSGRLQIREEDDSDRGGRR